MKRNLLNLDSLPSRFVCDGVYDVHTAKLSELPRLVEIINEGFAYQDEARGRARITEDEQLQLIDEEVVYTVNDQEDRVIGTYSLNTLTSRPATLHLTRLAISQEHRGCGIAAKLMTTQEDIARSIGFQAIDIGYMHVAPIWLPSFYRRIGYEDIPDSTYHWQGIEIDEMIKKL